MARAPRELFNRRLFYQEKYGATYFASFSMEGWEGVGEVIENLLAAVEDPEPILKEASKVIGRALWRNFERGGSRQRPWPDILPSSRARRKGNQDAPPLTDTEQFKQAVTGMRSLSDTPSSGLPYSLFELDGDSVRFGVDRIDAHLHQYGSPRPGTHPDGTPKGWPPRPYMVITGYELRSIRIRYERYLKQAALREQINIEGGE